MADVERASYDVVVIGAGPSGMAAAVEAAVDGARVALLDQQARVGGAYWRHHPSQLDGDSQLHHDWTTFQRLRSRLDTVDVRTEHSVWALERVPGSFVVRATAGEVQRRPVLLDAGSVIVATGAYERVLPFPGWTLPGVTTVGAGQALLKGTLVAPGTRVLVAGAGPLLLVVADGLLRSGVDVVAVAEASHPTKYGLHPSSWSGAASRAREGAAYARTLAEHRVPYHAGYGIVRAWGDGRVEHAEIATRRGRSREYDVDAVLVSHGFTPQLELLLQAGASSRVDGDGSLVVEVDVQQRTSVPGLLATGEVTGVGGANLAILEGYVAGRTLSGRAVDRAVHDRIAVHRRFARAMHSVHTVGDDTLAALPDDVLVCRCEEVSAGDIRRACRDLGVDDARGAKLMTRAGMGLCQGRMCSRTVRGLVAVATGREVGDDDVARAGERLPVQPVPLENLAAETRPS
jgi:NADPH-dependent 2,4-dienoyl-CoA reductase/sulfur reductase-like enzyme